MSPQPAYPGRIRGAVAVGVVLVLLGIVVGGPIGGLVILAGAVIAGIALAARYQRM